MERTAIVNKSELLHPIYCLVASSIPFSTSAEPKEYDIIKFEAFRVEWGILRNGLGQRITSFAISPNENKASPNPNFGSISIRAEQLPTKLR